ncbi:ATP-binding protein [Lysinibacillus sp. NPDC096418]|uniref:hybrid sensor histidine kinase/response regulator n=1 Tax=Lysinibacillus sp. NPDC096418 TaxID=3364138 RepID=UPI0038153655
MLPIKKTTKIHILIIGLIFFTLTILRILWLAYFLPMDEQPYAQDGVWDMGNQALQDDQIFYLNGEWLYYPGALLDGKENITDEDWSSTEGKILTVPFNEKNPITQKYGTYRLKILLNENGTYDQNYAVHIPAIQTASALYVNGKLLGQSGHVGTNADAHKGQAAPYTVYFSADTQEIDLNLQVSNLDTPKDALITKQISFSTAKAMMHKQKIIEISLASISIILIMYALFSILVYLFIYRRKTVFLFTAGFLFPLADELISNDRSILNWLQLDYVWSLKLSNIIYLGASYFFVQFMRILLTKYHSARCFRWLSILYGMSALLIIILPIHWLYFANIIFFILYFVSFISVATLALKEYIDKQRTSAFIVFTVLSTISGILWGLIKTVFILEIPFYPFDYLIALLAFAGYWFKQFYENTQEINVLVADLHKNDRLKDEFLSNSSQRLWDPMNKMITIAQSIYDNPNNTFVVEDKNNLKNLINVGRSMSFTLNDIQDFTRLKEDKLHLHTKNVNIQSAITGVFDLLRFITEGKKIQMNSNIPKTFPYVIADEKRLIQILFNLLHNAIKFTSASFIEISAKVENNMALIHIHDNGLGMDDDVQKFLSIPYGQNNSSEDSIGLGLFVSKQLIELHGGTLQIHSIPNKGSDVFFTLPLADEISNEEDHYSESLIPKTLELKFNKIDEQSTDKKFRILIIDDDPVNLTIIRSIFTLEEYEVATVTSSEKGLELLQNDNWDLVIIDAMLPFISGYALIQMIREQYSVLELPILLLAARNYPEDVYTGFAYGANDYVTKPINSLELKVRGRALIDLKYNINQRLHLETAWLQAQIQPHFLFNTLNTIASLSTIDSDRMIELMHHFGEYLHASFDVKNLQRVVPLQHELELVRSYLYIEQQRFEHLLKIEWDIDENIEIDIPPISLQTLVENAVNHGVLKQENGGTVRILIKDCITYVEISVIDNGVGIDANTLAELLSDLNKHSRGIGLRNTDLRLKRIYNERLIIRSTPNEGTHITFHIPKNKK